MINSSINSCIYIALRDTYWHMKWTVVFVGSRGVARKTFTLDLRITLQVSWTPHFNPKLQSVRFIGPLTYKVFKLYHLNVGLFTHTCHNILFAFNFHEHTIN
jgi:hypothetical protein